MPRIPGTAWLHGPGRRRQWRRRVVRRILALVCAVAAGFAVVVVSRSDDTSRLVRVVVAARPLAAGELATPGSVRETLWPADLAPAGSLTSVQEVLGRPFAASMGVGEPVTRARVTGSSLLSGQPSDAVALHVRVPDPGVLAMVSTGDRVDLWGPDGPVARAVVVLSVDHSVTTEFGAVLQGQGSSSGYAMASPGLVVSAGQQVASAILAVPEDALGRPQISLVLRRPTAGSG